MPSSARSGKGNRSFAKVAAEETTEEPAIQLNGSGLLRQKEEKKNDTVRMRQSMEDEARTTGRFVCRVRMSSSYVPEERVTVTNPPPRLLRLLKTIVSSSCEEGTVAAQKKSPAAARLNVGRLARRSSRRTPRQEEMVESRRTVTQSNRVRTQTLPAAEQKKHRCTLRKQTLAYEKIAVSNPVGLSSLPQKSGRAAKGKRPTLVAGTSTISMPSGRKGAAALLG